MRLLRIILELVVYPITLTLQLTPEMMRTPKHQRDFRPVHGPVLSPPPALSEHGPHPPQMQVPCHRSADQQTMATPAAE